MEQLQLVPWLPLRWQPLTIILFETQYKSVSAVGQQSHTQRRGMNRVYFHPTPNDIFLQLTDNQFDCTIVNLQGTIVDKFKSGSGIFTRPFLHPAGIYLLKAVAGNGTSAFFSRIVSMTR